MPTITTSAFMPPPQGTEYFCPICGEPSNIGPQMADEKPEWCGECGYRHPEHKDDNSR